MRCKVCTIYHATIKHHMSYFPEVTTGVCESCHKNIHSGRCPELRKKYVKYPKGDAQLFYQGNNRITKFCLGLQQRRAGSRN